MCGDFIPNNKSQLGPNAQDLVENEPQFNEMYFETENGEKKYQDYQMIWTVVAYLHGTTETSDPFELCTEVVNLLDEFTVEAESYEFDNAPNPIVSSNKYCVVEIFVPGGSVIADPLVNRSLTIDSEQRKEWYDRGQRSESYHNGYLNYDDLVFAFENDLMDTIEFNSHGYNTLRSGWGHPGINPFRYSLQNLGLTVIGPNGEKPKELQQQMIRDAFANY